MLSEDRAVLMQHTQHANSFIHEMHHTRDNISSLEQLQQGIACSAPVIAN